jgi:hypothetical protein
VGALLGTVRHEDVRARVFADVDYVDLFQRLDESQLDRIWAMPDVAERLRVELHDGSVDARSRFLAAEVLFARDPSFPRDESATELAEIYASALRTGASRYANPWGFPGRVDGPLAHHVVERGPAAVRPFARLLDDATPIEYAGSREATFGNAYQFRVKDIAASLIAQIIGADVPTAIDARQRDREIEAIRNRLDDVGAPCDDR